MTHPGMFIVFEGVDRCGKTTQSDILTRKLDAVKFTFPDRTTETGRIIHKYLNHEIELDDVAVHLLFAANRWERAKIIRDLIAIGKNVVLDRYSFSGVAYSVAKMRPELDITRCWASEIHLPAPDIIFYLHGDESDIISRAEFGTERYERADFQRRVKKIFDDIFRKYQKTHPYTQIEYISANKTITEAENEIGEHVIRYRELLISRGDSKPNRNIYCFRELE